MSQLDKNSGCYGNLSCHRLIMGKMKIGIYCYLIEDILTKVVQKCSLSGPLPTFYSCPNISFLSVVMATEILNLKTIIKKLSHQKRHGGYN